MLTYVQWNWGALRNLALYFVPRQKSENSDWVVGFTVAWPFPLSHEHGYVRLEWRRFLSKL